MQLAGAVSSFPLPYSGSHLKVSQPRFSMVFICTKWSNTCWSAAECWESTLGLAFDVVSDYMLISLLSLSVEPLEMCADALVALALLGGDLKPKDLPSPFLLMCVCNKLNLP